MMIFIHALILRSDIVIPHQHIWLHSYKQLHNAFLVVNRWQANSLFVFNILSVSCKHLQAWTWKPLQSVHATHVSVCLDLWFNMASAMGRCLQSGFNIDCRQKINLLLSSSF